MLLRNHKTLSIIFNLRVYLHFVIGLFEERAFMCFLIMILGLLLHSIEQILNKILID